MVMFSQEADQNRYQRSDTIAADLTPFSRANDRSPTTTASSGWRQIVVRQLAMRAVNYWIPHILRESVGVTQESACKSVGMTQETRDHNYFRTQNVVKVHPTHGSAPASKQWRLAHARPNQTDPLIIRHTSILSTKAVLSYWKVDKMESCEKCGLKVHKLNMNTE